MDRLLIEGGRVLRGTVRTAGSKNAVLPVLAASLLTRETVRVPNAPRLLDVESMMEVLREIGSEAERNADGSVEVRSSEEPNTRAGWEHVRKMRGSVAVLGPLLATTGRAEVSLPGGCVLGVRPLDVHFKGLAALGASVRIEHGYIVAEAPTGGLRGAEMFLGSANGSSVLGTANVLMAAVLAPGRTVIHGAACEPEVADLADCLVSMGARVSGIGSPRLEIDGVESLHGTTHSVIPDRIEAGTYLLAGCLTGGDVTVEGCRPDHLSALIDRLTEAQVPIERGERSETGAAGEGFVQSLPRDPADPGERPRPTDVTTLPFPGFPTDLQAQWMALMTRAEGFSIITERIYPDRYMHLAELLRMGANIRRQGATAIVQGVGELSGAPVTASDLRASAALVLAGLVARGETEVHRVYHIDRGYERIEERLLTLGAAIRRA